MLRVYAGNTRHTYSAPVYGHYCIMYWKIIRKFVMIAFFHFQWFIQDTVQGPPL